MKKNHVQFTRSMLVLALAGSILLSGCQPLPPLQVQADPPSYEWHGDCGRGLTGTVPPFPDVHLSVLGLADAGQARLEISNDMSPSYLWLNDFSNPSTYVVSPAVAGNYHLSATIHPGGGATEQWLDPVAYIIPHHIGLKVEKLADQQVQLRAVPDNIDIPWTYQYSFCARPADAPDSTTDQWRPIAAEDTWLVPMPVTGRWTFYVLVTIFQQGHDLPAASGEQIVLNADIDACRIGTGC